MPIVVELCQRAVCMNAGRVIAAGDVHARAQGPRGDRGLPRRDAADGDAARPRAGRRRREIADERSRAAARAATTSPPATRRTSTCCARSTCASTPGRITGLIGLNGAGKSTLVKTICGFLPPKSGSVAFRGEDISGIEPHRLIDRGICCIPQESSLFAYLSVAAEPDAAAARAAEALRRGDAIEAAGGVRALSGAAREAVERAPGASRAASRSSSSSRRRGCSSRALCLDRRAQHRPRAEDRRRGVRLDREVHAARRWASC